MRLAFWELVTEGHWTFLEDHDKYFKLDLYNYGPQLVGNGSKRLARS